MNNLKLAISDLINSFKAYILKKDENSAIKYKNLIVVTVAILALVIALCFAFSSSSNEKLVLHPNDNNSSDTISFEDNNAVATDPLDIEANVNAQNDLINQNSDAQDLQIQPNAQPAAKESSSQTPKEQETEISVANIQDTNSKDEVAPQENTEQGNISLYCDKFSSKKFAEEAKANIAMSSGLISNVVQQDKVYKLLLGPFKTREEAIETFNKLDKLQLINQCTLETRNN